jgi:hypothetical protein
MITLELPPLGVLPVDTGLVGENNGGNFLDEAVVYIIDTDRPYPKPKFTSGPAGNFLDETVVYVIDTDRPTPKPK